MAELFQPCPHSEEASARAQFVAAHAGAGGVAERQGATGLVAGGDGWDADFADADTAPAARRQAAGRAALAALPWLLLAAYFVIMRFSAGGLRAYVRLADADVAHFAALRGGGGGRMARSRAEGAEGGRNKRRGRALCRPEMATGAARRAVLTSRCLAVASVRLLPDLMPDLLPDLWRGAPLTEAEAPLRTEAVYGVAGAFDSEAESGSFFVPRVSRMRCSDRTAAASATAWWRTRTRG